MMEISIFVQIVYAPYLQGKYSKTFLPHFVKIYINPTIQYYVFVC